MASIKVITSVVTSIIRKYWIGYPSYIIDNYIQRHVFEIALLINSLGDIKEKSIIDVGGGWGLFAAACSSLGMHSKLLEDFGDPGKSNVGDPRQSLPSDYGVDVIRRDVIKDGIGLTPESVNAITSFHMIEHLHASPKPFLHDAMMALQPNGVLLLSVPNCVNLRKRITVPLGKGSWSTFSEWYESPIFRGHVREPDVQDLKKIAQDLSLCDYRIFGRNWLGCENKNSTVRKACRIADNILRYIPSLCSDLYLLGWRR